MQANTVVYYNRRTNSTPRYWRRDAINVSDVSTFYLHWAQLCNRGISRGHNNSGLDKCKARLFHRLFQPVNPEARPSASSPHSCITLIDKREINLIIICKFFLRASGAGGRCGYSHVLRTKKEWMQNTKIKTYQLVTGYLFPVCSGFFAVRLKPAQDSQCVLMKWSYRFLFL